MTASGANGEGDPGRHGGSDRGGRRRDVHHEECLDFVNRFPGQLKVLPTVVTETAWMLERYLSPDAEAAFLDSVGVGQLELTAIDHGDLRRMAELVRQYADFPLGTVDASVVAVSERLGLTEVATVDRRHFTAVRPKHAKSFTLLP
ncbi:type II toxin-antitoxin system VapC family toxin [Streptomyces cavernicola]|uniref:PIN domain-containing protein n=1 Tax=Streptomyces cavernicola TaxID=3043613 RepID=A0ABT6SLS1_9ACTN|nr:PIN domain-containing protein [Streptomyces sp. B-S-A6]MDI3409141.1 PIN domain-containing protein [Streptomyces sp. B-S-A6]